MLPKNGVVLAALGTPKQELWIRNTIVNGGPPNLYIGIGGAVDYYSGATPSPPAILCALGLEWLYRLIKHPGTRIPRLTNFLPRFVWRYIVVGQ
jgi:N-acetylglucosaminyldiphosphoundecaprenol N-acetyl-beta-D-mannosaminyltransferase